MENLDIDSIESNLYKKMHSALLKNLQDAYSRYGRLFEHDFVAILTLLFTKDLFCILKEFFPDYQFGITGIFCHQKPIVKFKERGVELGDLLFIYKYTDENNKETYNSLLTQAKVAKNYSNIKSGDKLQLELYQTWPEFTYTKGALKGIRRDIYCKKPTDGAQFLLFDNNPVSTKEYPGVFPIGFAKVLSEMSQYRVYPDFSKDLIKFLKFDNGRKFEAEKDIHNDSTNWSQMIWDLINICKDAFFKRKKIGIKEGNRYNEYNNYMQKSDLESPPLFDGTTNRNITSEEENAPSIVCIEAKKHQSINQ
ncbi:MAG: hypothetical protein LBB84_03455 [Tannerellaceae bacterium]|jgi:hypothetical protein|nr:hypothetical protein [Tannerellaceae bacterium]